MTWQIVHGDCIDVLRAMESVSVDAVVTDPPYGLSDEPDVAEVLTHWLAGDDYKHRGGGFMGRSWDSFVPGPAYWRECFRVLKPGGYCLAFGGTRTVDLLAIALRLAGFEKRDEIAWMYGSGFPKSLNVSAAIDKAAGAERAPGVEGRYSARRPRDDVEAQNAYSDGVGDYGSSLVTAPATPDAVRWDGWGTALKPSFEPVVVARKPLAGTVAGNVLAWGTGALNVDGCRVTALTPAEIARSGKSTNGGVYGDFDAVDWKRDGKEHPGRWPANVVLDPEAAAVLDEQTGELTSGKMQPTHTDAGRVVFGANATGGYTTMETYGDTGGASRFFYVAKADSAERNAGLAVTTLFTPPDAPTRNDHPTVKPIALMRWLVRLVTPPDGLVLDPFAGSGTTGCAAVLEDFDFVGIEREAASVGIARARIAHWSNGATENVA